jgi:hypothetical protein
MSRGLGKLQQQLFAILHAHAHGGAATAHEAACGLDTAELASAVRYSNRRCTILLDRRDLVAVRRALRTLERRKLVVGLGRLGRSRSHRWHVGLLPRT